jgi:hypothetical protein
VLVVVENKVAEDDDRQARELNVTGARVKLADSQEAIIVLWRDLLDAFIALRDRDLVAGAEAAVLDDFLLYTEDHFPALGPFRILRLAHGNRFRQTRRLRQLLGEAVGLDAFIDVHGAYIETPAGDAIGAKTYLSSSASKRAARRASRSSRFSAAGSSRRARSDSSRKLVPLAMLPPRTTPIRVGTVGSTPP